MNKETKVTVDIQVHDDSGKCIWDSLDSVIAIKEDKYPFDGWFRAGIEGEPMVSLSEVLINAVVYAALRGGFND